MKKKTIELLIERGREENTQQREYEEYALSEFNMKNIVDLAVCHSGKEKKYLDDFFNLFDIKSPFNDWDIVYIPTFKPNITSGVIENNKTLIVYHGLSVLNHFLGSMVVIRTNLVRMKLPPLMFTYLLSRLNVTELILIYGFFTGKYHLNSIKNGFKRMDHALKNSWSGYQKIFFCLHELGHDRLDHYIDDLSSNLKHDTSDLKYCDNFNVFPESNNGDKKNEFEADEYAYQWLKSNNLDVPDSINAAIDLLSRFGYYEILFGANKIGYPNSINRAEHLNRKVLAEYPEQSAYSLMKEIRKKSEITLSFSNDEKIQKIINKAIYSNESLFLEGLSYITAQKNYDLLINDFLHRVNYFEKDEDEILSTEDDRQIYDAYVNGQI